jgi:hypothetical protein
MAASTEPHVEMVIRAVYPDFAFTDAQWNEIASDADIPPSAASDMLLGPRRVIETTVGIYRLRQQRRAEDAMLPGDVRKELAAIQHGLWRYQERLRHIEEEQPVGWGGLSFKKEIRVLRCVETRLWLLAGDIEDAPRPERDIYYLVGVLDGIWREFHGGEMISASTKSTNKSRAFVETILRIADPAIGGGTIDEAIKHARSRRGDFVVK